MRSFLIFPFVMGFLYSYSQDQAGPIQHASFFEVETGFYGSLGNPNYGLSTFGVGVNNYIHMVDFSGKRNITTGIAYPMRLFYNESGNTPEKIESMFSVAALFQAQIQLHAVKDKLWFFMATGPEYRWVGRETNRHLFMVQIEAGFRRVSGSSFIKLFEVGTTNSFLPNGHLVQGLISYSGFFMRAGFLN
jgi:hypothetical protein